MLNRMLRLGEVRLHYHRIFLVARILRLGSDLGGREGLRVVLVANM